MEITLISQTSIDFSNLITLLNGLTETNATEHIDNLCLNSIDSNQAFLSIIDRLINGNKNPLLLSSDPIVLRLLSFAFIVNPQIDGKTIGAISAYTDIKIVNLDNFNILSGSLDAWKYGLISLTAYRQKKNNEPLRNLGKLLYNQFCKLQLGGLWQTKDLGNQDFLLF